MTSVQTRTWANTGLKGRTDSFFGLHQRCCPGFPVQRSSSLGWTIAHSHGIMYSTFTFAIPIPRSSLLTRLLLERLLPFVVRKHIVCVSHLPLLAFSCSADTYALRRTLDMYHMAYPHVTGSAIIPNVRASTFVGQMSGRRWHRAWIRR